MYTFLLQRLLGAAYVWLLPILLCAQAPGPVPQWVATMGKLPQLAYSTGTDRLGSAKMGYIDTGIVLRVADTSGALYKVQLSGQRHAYLDKVHARPVAAPASAGQPALSSSWMLRGGAAADTLHVGLSRKVPYTSRMELSPARIVVELHGVQANTNWITQLQSSAAVQYVAYDHTADDVMEITVYLKHTHHFGYSIGYDGGRLRLTIKHPPADKQLKGKRIVVDAGHGGSNTGARGGSTGILEKDYTLLFALALQKELEAKGATVLMVRTSDTAIDNKDRVLWAIQQQADLLVSIHLNAAGRSTVQGTSTYYKHAAYYGLSQHVLAQLLKINGLREFGLIGSFNFQPVQPTEFPGTLVEVAFLSNPEDEQKIMDAAFRAQVARKIKEGIVQWYREVSR